MTVCTEMKRLRKWLDNNGIEWKDMSESHRFMPDRDDYICRTWFIYKGYKVSVINGFGTYGGFDTFHRENLGLLEIMLDGEVTGHLYLKDVIEMLEALE